MPLSDARARALLPSAFGFVHLVFKILPGLKAADLEDLAKRLWSGDSNPAVVVSVAPLRVAAYTWDLDAVVILAFADDYAEGLDLAVGQRLLSANYDHEYGDGILADDIDAGPAATGGWHNVHPTIAVFLSDHRGHIEAQKRRIPEEAWRRTEALGRAKFAAQPHMARMGDPFFSDVSAGDQRDAYA